MESSPKKRARTISWPKKHAIAFDRMGIDWWESFRPSDDTFDLFPSLHCLSDRHFEVLHAHGIKYPDKPIVVDVSQTIARSRSREDASKVVTRRCILYLAHKCRPEYGREGLALQGIHLGDSEHRLADCSSDFLLNLGGNAFHTHRARKRLQSSSGELTDLHTCLEELNGTRSHSTSRRFPKDSRRAPREPSTCSNWQSCEIMILIQILQSPKPSLAP